LKMALCIFNIVRFEFCYGLRKITRSEKRRISNGIRTNEQE
jgi:hypothetical protein